MFVGGRGALGGRGKVGSPRWVFGTGRVTWVLGVEKALEDGEYDGFRGGEALTPRRVGLRWVFRGG